MAELALGLTFCRLANFPVNNHGAEQYLNLAAATHCVALRFVKSLNLTSEQRGMFEEREFELQQEIMSFNSVVSSSPTQTRRGT